MWPSNNYKRPRNDLLFFKGHGINVLLLLHDVANGLRAAAFLEFIFWTSTWEVFVLPCTVLRLVNFLLSFVFQPYLYTEGIINVRKDQKKVTESQFLAENLVVLYTGIPQIGDTVKVYRSCLQIPQVSR